MWVYACVGLGIVTLILICHGIVEYLSGKAMLEQTQEDNNRLIARQRKLEAENRKLVEDNRHLISKLSHVQTQAEGRWAHRYEEATGRISELERELKIKDALLKAMEGKVAG